jgi:hypothetical protein
MERDVMAIGGGKTLTIFLAADLKKFNSGLNDARGGMSRFGGSINDVLGPALIGAGIAAGALATKLAIDGVKAAIDDEAAMSRLATTMQNLGLAHDIQPVEDYIYQLERSLGIADTDLRPAYDRLVRALGDTGKAQDALSLSLDVSAGSGKTLEQVTDALGKAYEGNIAGLSRLGAGIDAAVIKSGDMDVITKTLSDTFSGQAETSAGTYEGQIKRLSTAADNMKEAFGAGLLRGLGDTNDATNDLVKAFEDLEPLIGSTGEAVGKFATTALKAYTNAVGDAGDESQAAAQQVKGVGNAAVASGGLFGEIFASLTGPNSPLGVFTRGLGAAGTGADNLTGKAYTTADGMERLAISTVRATSALQDFNGETGAGPAYKNSGVNPYAEYLRLQRIGILTLPTLTEKVEDQTTATGNGSVAVDELTKKQQKLIDKYEEGKTALADRGKQLLSEVDALNAARLAITDYTDALSANILSGVNLGTAYEAQFNSEGQKTGASLLDGFNQQIAQAEYFGQVLTAIKAQKADQGLIDQIASLGPEAGAALGQQILDEGLVPTLSEKWVSVNATVNELAKGLVPEGLIAGEQFALSTVQGTTATLLKEQKSLKKLGKQVGKIVGASFKAQLADDVAEAVRAVEAINTAAKAEAAARAASRSVTYTEQEVAQALSSLIAKADQRLGTLNNPVVA